MTVKIITTTPDGGRRVITEIIEGEKVVELGVSCHNVATGLAGDLVEAVTKIEVENGTGRTIGTEETLGISSGSANGIIKTTRNSNAELTGRKENASHRVSKEEGNNGGDNASESNADADGAQFGEIAKRILVEGGEVSRAEGGTEGGREKTAGDNADEFEEGREVGKVRDTISVDDRPEGVITDKIDGVREGTRSSAFVEFFDGLHDTFRL